MGRKLYPYGSFRAVSHDLSRWRKSTESSFTRYVPSAGKVDYKPILHIEHLHVVYLMNPSVTGPWRTNCTPRLVRRSPQLKWAWHTRTTLTLMRHRHSTQLLVSRLRSSRNLCFLPVGKLWGCRLLRKYNVLTPTKVFALPLQESERWRRTPLALCLDEKGKGGGVWHWQRGLSYFWVTNAITIANTIRLGWLGGTSVLLPLYQYHWAKCGQSVYIPISLIYALMWSIILWFGAIN